VTNLIDEVEEEIRREKVDKFLAVGWPWIVGFVVLCLAVAGGWQYWISQQQKTARATSESFVAAVQTYEKGDFDTAAKEFEDIAKGGHTGYRTLAIMQQAAVKTNQGDLKGAIALFDQAAASAGNTPLVRDLCKLRAAYLAADVESFDELKKRLQPLIAEGGDYTFLARELLAVESWENGDATTARTEFQALSVSLEAPDGIKQRASAALAVLGPAAAPKSDAPKSDASKSDAAAPAKTEPAKSEGKAAPAKAATPAPAAPAEPAKPAAPK
jgi:hypothetical protein